ADQLVGAVWQRVTCGGEGLPVPAVLRPRADRQPAWPVPCNWIGILRGLEAHRRRLARLRVVALKEPAGAHHAGSAVILARRHALASDDPLGSRDQVVTYEAIALVIALKQRDDLLQRWCSFT